MRLSKREVTDLMQIEEIIKSCKVCRIAMCDGDIPYVVPVNFGYTLSDGELTIFIHCAHEGRKIDIIKNNPNVCVEMDAELDYRIDHETACNNTCYYASVIAFGKIEEVTGREEKIAGFDILLDGVIGKGGCARRYDDASVDRTAVYKIVTRDFTAKENRRRDS